ncbi:MAG: zf-HC2 domain-containing protein [Actinomycetota bacterium]|nr:zf-HC2 domain-containing protein [Actinomycetota bacterium]
MACSELRRAAFLSGELAPAEREAFDVHLLECEACWQAVQDDRAGRAALAHLLTPPTPGLAERVALAVEVAARTGPPAPQAATRPAPQGSRRRLAIAAAALAIVALVGSLLVTVVGRTRAADPPAVAAVVALASQRSAAMPARLSVDGRAVEVHRYRVHGALTLIAVSARPFAMPAASHVVSGSNHRVWMADRGSLGLYCVNAPAGRHSMLAVAAMPAVALPSALAALGFSPA